MTKLSVSLRKLAGTVEELECENQRLRDLVTAKMTGLKLEGNQAIIVSQITDAIRFAGLGREKEPEYFSTISTLQRFSSEHGIHVFFLPEQIEILDLKNCHSCQAIVFGHHRFCPECGATLK